LIHF